MDIDIEPINYHLQKMFDSPRKSRRQSFNLFDQNVDLFDMITNYLTLRIKKLDTNLFASINLENKPDLSKNLSNFLFIEQ